MTSRHSSTKTGKLKLVSITQGEGFITGAVREQRAELHKLLDEILGSDNCDLLQTVVANLKGYVQVARATRAAGQ